LKDPASNVGLLLYARRLNKKGKREKHVEFWYGNFFKSGTMEIREGNGTDNIDAIIAKYAVRMRGGWKWPEIVLTGGIWYYVCLIMEFKAGAEPESLKPIIP
jgi:hypothetical protein